MYWFIVVWLYGTNTGQNLCVKIEQIMLQKNGGNIVTRLRPKTPFRGIPDDFRGILNLTEYENEKFSFSFFIFE